MKSEVDIDLSVEIDWYRTKVTQRSTKPQRKEKEEKRNGYQNSKARGQLFTAGRLLQIPKFVLAKEQTTTCK